MRFRVRHPRWWTPARADALWAGSIMAATVGLAVAPPGGRWPDAGEWACVAVACAALLWRRMHPSLTFLVSALAAEFYLARLDSHEAVVLLLAPLSALYTVAQNQRHRRLHLAVAGIAMVVLAVLHMIFKPESFIGTGTLALVAFGAVAVAAGEATRQRRAYLAEVEARAARAERERDAEIARRETDAARRLTEERLRIARDLHDVLGHQLAVINVQAAVAAQTVAGAPDQARTALAHVRAASKTALAELRDTIGLLRAPGGDPAAPGEPTVGLAGLDRLYASYRRLGLVITADTDVPAYLPAPADVTAYRIIQEALTNVWRHAGPVATTVRVDRDDERLTVYVGNRAPAVPPPPAPGAGHGLIGGRERVTALGGELRAGPTRDGGFAVTAIIPTGGEPG